MARAAEGVVVGLMTLSALTSAFPLAAQTGTRSPAFGGCHYSTVPAARGRREILERQKMPHQQNAQSVAKTRASQVIPRFRMAAVGMGAGVKTWEELGKQTGPVSDRVLIGDAIANMKGLPGGLTLFRDRNGWCPYSERVWLAMLAKGISVCLYLPLMADSFGTMGFVKSGFRD